MGLSKVHGYMLYDGTVTDQQIATGANIALSKIANNANIMLATGATMSGALNMGSHSITNLLDPVNPQDSATKNYVDGLIQGLKAKQSVKAASTGSNLTLTGTYTLDTTVALSVGDRVLVKDQTTTSQNGIYVVQSGAWTRATDSDTWSELVSAYVFVEQGTLNADTSWTCTADQGGTIGSTAIAWVLFGRAGGDYTWGTGLSQSGNQISVDSTVTRLGNTVTGTGTSIVLSNSPTIVTPTIASFANANHNHSNAAGGGTLDASVISTGTLSAARGGTGVSNTNTITLGGNISTSGAFSTTGAYGLTLALGGATTATIPSGTITLADISTVQTLTNKTLTAPVITNPKIDQILSNSDGLPILQFGDDSTSCFHMDANDPNSLLFSATGANANIGMILSGRGTGWVTILGTASNLAGSIVTVDGTQTLTNKTLTTPTIGSFVNANHNHSNAAGGGTLDVSAIATGTLSAARGGTGVSNSSTITLGGNISTASSFTTVGAFGLTLTASAVTNATLPSGTITLADISTAQTFTNKQLTAPKIDQINDTTNNKSVLQLLAPISSVNYFTMNASIATNAISLVAGGTDTNISMNLNPKGAGWIYTTTGTPTSTAGAHVTVDATQTLTGKTLTTPTISDFTNANHAHTGASSGGTIAITSLTGTLAVGHGGTGLTTFGGSNTILFTTAADTLSSVTVNSTATRKYLSQTSSGTPAFNQITIADIDSTIITTGRYYANIPLPGTPNGVTTTFTASNSPVAGTETVYVDGVAQLRGAGNAYTMSGAVVTFIEAPASNAILTISYLV